MLKGPGNSIRVGLIQLLMVLIVVLHWGSSLCKWGLLSHTEAPYFTILYTNFKAEHLNVVADTPQVVPHVLKNTVCVYFHSHISKMMLIAQGPVQSYAKVLGYMVVRCHYGRLSVHGLQDCYCDGNRSILFFLDLR